MLRRPVFRAVAAALGLGALFVGYLVISGPDETLVQEPPAASDAPSTTSTPTVDTDAPSDQPEVFVYEDENGNIVVSDQQEVDAPSALALATTCSQSIALLKEAVADGQVGSAPQSQILTVLYYTRLAEELCAFRVYVDHVFPILNMWNAMPGTQDPGELPPVELLDTALAAPTVWPDAPQVDGIPFADSRELWNPSRLPAPPVAEPDFSPDDPLRNPEVARERVTKVFTDMLQADDLRVALAGVESGSRFSLAFREFMSSAVLAGELTPVVDSVQFPNEQVCADSGVSFPCLFVRLAAARDGEYVTSLLNTYFVAIDDEWFFSDESMCRLLAMQAVSCPVDRPDSTER